MQWRPNYKEMLNNKIKEFLAKDKEMSDCIKKFISALSANIRDISVELKFGTYTGDSV